MTEEFKHIPVMPKQVLELIRPERGGVFIDGTLGGGGHSELILEALPDDDDSKLYGIDRDGDAIIAASTRLERFGDRFAAVRGNFFDMRSLLSERGVHEVDGILLDLGVSSYQLDASERGFSYHADASLDMRMDKSAALDAAQVVNTYAGERLYEIIRDYGEERYASRIANAIVREREKSEIKTTLELAEIVKAAVPAQARWEGTHPCRRTFQALRIEVNSELDGLDEAIVSAEALLKSGGVLAIITFHSLEDRIVKRAFKRFEEPCVCSKKAPICVCGKVRSSRIITRKPVVADEGEQEGNNRARSAKLRAICKL